MMLHFNNEYVTHACKKCKIFFELENIKEFQ